MKRSFTLCLALGSGLLSPSGCVLGRERAPGCRVGAPDDCDPGFVCRAGACFRYNTEAGTPIDPSKQDGVTDSATRDAAADAPAE